MLHQATGLRDGAQTLHTSGKEMPERRLRARKSAGENDDSTRCTGRVDYWAGRTPCTVYTYWLVVSAIVYPLLTSCGCGCLACGLWIQLSATRWSS